ncbi:MAG: CAP domain-containing protein [Planctomycetota bacterium]|nr:CAP domain-containing protein [Planctomycetota bacterium]
MRLREIGAVVAWAVLAVVIVCQQPVVALQEVPQPASADQVNAVKQLYQAHSVARGERGLVGSRLVAEINRDAQKHADWMASTGQFVHSNLDYWEVILMGPQTPEKALEGWLDSKDHRKILMSGGEIGFGHARINGVAYWVGMVR